MPNSMLWIGLVVLWLFVLFPMLADRHPRIRRTTDAALATRVLHRGDGAPRHVRGPATGHDSDPNWRAEDIVDAPEFPLDDDFVPDRRGRGGYDPEADAIARAMRYRARQRVALGLVLATVVSAAVALLAAPVAWWACGAAVLALGVFLAYLRHQVRLEEEIRRKRAARLARRRTAHRDEDDDGEDTGDDPGPHRRPGAVVLEIDDEDPAFEHLDPFAEPLQEEQDLPRAVGE